MRKYNHPRRDDFNEEIKKIILKYTTETDETKQFWCHLGKLFLQYFGANPSQKDKEAAIYAHKKCSVCGKYFTENDQIEFHHISRKNHCVDNLIPIHADCHRRISLIGV